MAAPSLRAGIVMLALVGLGTVGLGTVGLGAIGVGPAFAGASPPVPRFASLRADEVNLRTGPGRRYPIEWVLTRVGMPVEILAEYQQWRRIRDWQGTEGWVQERMVDDRRDVVVTGGIAVFHRDPSVQSAILARAEPGVVARLIACREAWCKVEASDITGWIVRSAIWGVFPNESAQQ